MKTQRIGSIWFKNIEQQMFFFVVSFLNIPLLDTLNFWIFWRISQNYLAFQPLILKNKNF